ncbi:MAG: DNA polymerase III subunit gamma/tau [Solirubrobacterales bacterium]
MSESTSLYRRHRPGSFDEVVGQTHVVRTLRNAVEQGKVHHAYLFVGSRGTGKTSMAKILARSLNCERGGPTITPCGECESCVTIAAGTSVDVIEMDAASNRSVDDVRDLRERVAYAPAGGHWKVYILDEAHMLTKEAWNAFLKTLEEPPPNTVFVLATTESHKVMATIADRCQRFDFQRPSLEQISEVLNRVAAAESIEVEDGAAAMIARSASGSFRDALGTLDQLVAFGGSQVELKDVLEMLGAADADLLFETIDAVVAEDPKQVLMGIERMARSGRDPSQFARDLLAHLRHLLIVQTTGEVPTTFVVTATDTGRMQAQAQAIQPANLVRTIDELATALTAVREGDDARMAVEIALLKAARPDLDPNTEGLLRRIERLEQGGGASSPPTPKTPRQDDSPPAEDPPPAEEEEAEASPSADPAPAAAGPAGQDALSLEEIQRVWPAVLHKLHETAPALAGALEGARPVSFEAGALEVGFPPDMTFLKRNADSPEKRDTVAAAFAAVTGVGLRPTYVLLDGEAPPDTPVPGSEVVDEEELLERLKSEFDAEEVS